MNKKTKSNIWLWIKVNIIFLLVIGAIVLVIYLKTPKIDSFVKNDTVLYKYSELKDNLQTGDLIFLAGTNCASELIGGIIDSPFIHIGMIIKENDGELYIWDADIGQKAKLGPRLMTLDDKFNKSHCKQIGAVMKLNGERKFTSEDLKRVIDQNINKSMDKYMYSWALGKIAKNENKVFCSELIAETYQELRIMSNEKNAYDYGPDDFFFNRVKLMNGYSLSSPIYFVIPYEKCYNH